MTDNMKNSIITHTTEPHPALPLNVLAILTTPIIYSRSMEVQMISNSPVLPFLSSKNCKNLLYSTKPHQILTKLNIFAYQMYLSKIA